MIPYFIIIKAFTTLGGRGAIFFATRSSRFTHGSCLPTSRPGIWSHRARDFRCFPGRSAAQCGDGDQDFHRGRPPPPRDGKTGDGIRFFALPAPSLVMLHAPARLMGSRERGHRKAFSVWHGGKLRHGGPKRGSRPAFSYREKAVSPAGGGPDPGFPFSPRPPAIRKTTPEKVPRPSFKAARVFPFARGGLQTANRGDMEGYV